MLLLLLLLSTGLVLLLGAVTLAAHHLNALPYAPECPTCRCVTGQSTRLSRLDRMLARGGADVRLCPRCGWSGRMRWRLAAERVRGR
jgi:hypothetical protein